MNVMHRTLHPRPQEFYVPSRRALRNARKLAVECKLTLRRFCAKNDRQEFVADDRRGNGYCIISMNKESGWDVIIRFKPV